MSTHAAAAVEDALNRRLIAFLRRRGWRPRTIAFTGYGSPDFVRVLARVVLTRGPERSARVGAGAGPLQEAVAAQRGWRSYVTAPVGMLPVQVSVNGVDYTTRADRGGYVDLVVPGHGLAAGWHEIQIRARAAQPVTARVQVIDRRTTLGLLSDIDDTVMVTAVPRPLLAIWNSFIRHGTARRVVPGMAPMYRELLGSSAGAPVFYLSTGAWNVVPPLQQFLRRHGFPIGPMLMTDWGPTNTGWFRSGQEHKRQSLRRLAQEFPWLQWILVGDDGQHDPAIYREFAQEFPGRVAGIGIRELTPTQQVLSHGTTASAADKQRSAPVSGVTEVYGGDGQALAPAMLAGSADHRSEHQTE